jgi:predicted NACHT family NTPase
VFGLDNLMDLLFDSAMESINRNERVIQAAQAAQSGPRPSPADFTGVYQYALVEYGVGKPRPVLEIFRQSEIQQLFREALERNNPSKLLKNGEAFSSRFIPSKRISRPKRRCAAGILCLCRRLY